MLRGSIRPRLVRRLQTLGCALSIEKLPHHRKRGLVLHYPVEVEQLRWVAAEVVELELIVRWRDLACQRSEREEKPSEGWLTGPFQARRRDAPLRQRAKPLPKG